MNTLQESGGKHFILQKASLWKGWQVACSRPHNKTEASIKVIASSSGYYSMLIFPNENSKSQPKRSMKTQCTALAPGQTSQAAFYLDTCRNHKDSGVASSACLVNHPISAGSPARTWTTCLQYNELLTPLLQQFTGKRCPCTALWGCKWNSCSWHMLPRQGWLLPQANILLPWLLNSINPTGKSRGHLSNSYKDHHLFYGWFMFSLLRSNTTLLTAAACSKCGCKRRAGMSQRLWWEEDTALGLSTLFFFFFNQ